MKTSPLSFLTAALFLSAAALRAQVEYVDPAIGGQGVLLEPTRPTVSLPNSMVRVYPMRADQLDDQIQSFPLTIISHRSGELFWLMPGAGSPEAWDRPAAYDQEVETPYYYATRFDGSLIRTEFTPTARCGFFRFTFPSAKPVVLLANRLRGGRLDFGSNFVSGEERFHGMSAFFYGEFSAPVQVQSSRANQRLTVSAQAGQKTLGFRYGISFISAEQAKKNLREEIPAWDFEAIKGRARAGWNKALGADSSRRRHAGAEARFLHRPVSLF